MIPIPEDFTGFIAYYQDGYIVVCEVREDVYIERLRTWIGEQDKAMYLSFKDGLPLIATWNEEE